MSRGFATLVGIVLLAGTVYDLSVWNGAFEGQRLLREAERAPALNWSTSSNIAWSPTINASGIAFKPDTGEVCTRAGTHCVPVSEVERWLRTRPR